MTRHDKLPAKFCSVLAVAALVFSGFISRQPVFASRSVQGLQKQKRQQQQMQKQQAPQQQKTGADASEAEASKPLPMTGKRVPAMDGFDEEFCKFLNRWHVPGASVAIYHKGKLAFARGYGYADKDSPEPVQPDSIFRLCSVSKIITSVAILKLIEEGKLSLDTKAFPILKLPLERDPSRRPDPRIHTITIRQLLESSAGWDRRATGDPMFVPIIQEAASQYSTSLRPTAQSIIRYEYSRYLDFMPGTQFSYSNFEYAVLGEIIARITGRKYEDYVRYRLLAPLGITSISAGKTRVRAPKEVRYHPWQGEAVGPSVFPNVRGPLLLEYGGDFCLEAMTADCGWIGSTVDLARFVSAVFGDLGPELQVLSPSSVKMMTGRPAMPCWQNTNSYFAMGWEIEHASSKEDFLAKKEGCLPGAEALVGHYTDGTTIALAYNTRPWAYKNFQDKSYNLMEKTRKAHKYVADK